MFSKSVFAVFAGLAAVASAVLPVGDPTGNPILKPGLAEQVPAGVAYTITRTPTTPKTDLIELILLRGPSTNVKPIATIAAGIPNSGTYSWTPSTALENDVTHYGLQLIVESTGQYQYSTQFGISNPKYSSVSSSAASTAASVSKSAHAETASSTSSCTTTALYTSASANATSVYSTGTGYHTFTASTGGPISNSSIVYPTKSMSVPSSLKTTATTVAGSSAAATTTPAATGAAGHLTAGLGLAGAIAGLVMAL